MRPATLLDPVWWKKLLFITTHSLIFSLIFTLTFPVCQSLIHYPYIFPHPPALLHSSRTFWPLKMRPISCLETLETNDLLMRYHTPEEQMSQGKNFSVHHIWGSYGTVLRLSSSGTETPCSLVDMHNYFGGTCYVLHLRQGSSFLSNSFCSRPTIQYHILYDSKIISF